jgi:hypothetical protein
VGIVQGHHNGSVEMIKTDGFCWQVGGISLKMTLDVVLEEECVFTDVEIDNLELHYTLATLNLCYF